MEYMEPKHSIQTYILSKQWKDLWKSLATFKFHHLRDIKVVSHILSGRDDSLPLHILSYFHLTRGSFSHLDLETKLLEVMKYGASHNVHVLKITFGRNLEKDIELPPSIFQCQFLVALKLDFKHPASHGYIKILFPKSLNLPALKALYLSWFSHFHYK
ncbi:hypothetical protein QL285_013054 [Trifolium repens]|nr:hypothetical protein QL285_013054 [Trifolium repens]